MLSTIHLILLLPAMALCWLPVLFLERRNDALYTDYLQHVRDAWNTQQVQAAEARGTKWRRHIRLVLVIGILCAIASMLILHVSLHLIPIDQPWPAASK